MTHLILAMALLPFSGSVTPLTIAALRNPGVTVPAATLPNLSGGSLSLWIDDSRPTVIVVFGSWCDPCRKNMPAILNLARVSSARFVGIDELESVKDARAFTAAAKVTFPTALLTAPAFDGPGVTDEERASTGTDIPAIYVIDSHGKSYRSFVGEAALNVSNIEAALSELAKAPL